MYMKKTDYHDYHIPLEEREDILFSKIAELDKESYSLFCNSIDKKETEEELLSRLTELNHILEEIKDGYYYLYSLEVLNQKYANLRAMWKAVLTLMTTAYAYNANKLLGIASFIVLAKVATKEYIKEKKQLEESLEQYNCQAEMNTIQKTLDNCETFLHPKQYIKQKEE